jgi:hypothetical protein
MTSNADDSDVGGKGFGDILVAWKGAVEVVGMHTGKETSKEKRYARFSS